jgi:glycerate 2-kinase
MRILVAPDKFKGSLSAAEVAQHIAAGLREALPAANVTTLPIADGGEGTATVICPATDGEWRECNVHDPLGRLVAARYCVIENGATAVMEMSAAAGLWRVPEQLRNPETASSSGVGEMLIHAARGGAQRILIGLGGSATNDGGVGMARALGFRFLDKEGAELGHAVTELLQLHRIERPAESPLPAITAAADVRNPLLGANGATRTYAAQKGADANQIERLELALARLAHVVARELGGAAAEILASGAAGGLGFGLLAFCGAAIRSGFDVVAERVGLEAAVRNADVIVTGEGRIDAQTLEGKAPAGVAKLARKHGKRVLAIAGEFRAAPGWESLFDHVFSLVDANVTTEEAMKRPAELLRKRACEAGVRLRSQRP